MKAAPEEVGTMAAKAGSLCALLKRASLLQRARRSTYHLQENPCTNVAFTGHGNLDVNRVLAELCRETGGGQSDFSKGTQCRPGFRE